jgi:hypothetical protein
MHLNLVSLLGQTCWRLQVYRLTCCMRFFMVDTWEAFFMGIALVMMFFLFIGGE